MSQETIESASDEQILGLEPEETVAAPEETEVPDEPKAKEDTRVPLDELIAERHAKQRLEQELHALRIATLQGVTANQAPKEDPVEAALSRIAKRAGWDDTLASVLGPTMRPLLEELAYMRELNEQTLQELGQQRQEVSRLSERDRTIAQNAELTRIIPDLEKVGPKMLDLLKGMPPDVQKMYAANPQLLIPLAQAVRSSNGVEAPKPRVNKAQLSVDTGGSPSQPLTLDANALANIKPGSKEFEALARNFYGEG